jgi:hypothetical protein
MFSQCQYDKLQADLNEQHISQHTINKRLIDVVNTQIKAIQTPLDQIQSQLDAQATPNPANLDAALQSTKAKEYSTKE